MAQNNNNTIAIIAVVAVLILAGIYMSGNMPKFIGAVTGTETINRVLPASAGKGTTFPVTWNLNGASGQYGVLIVDTLTGGCTFSDGSTKYEGVILNPDTSKTLTVTAPTASGSCTLTGSYSLGNVSRGVVLAAQSVPIVCSPIWSSGAWSACSATCVWSSQGACVASYTAGGTQSRANTDSANCGVTTGQPTTSQTCTSPCTRVITQNTASDTNCDNIVKRSELENYLQGFIDGGVQRTDFVAALLVWINGGGQ
jgi:hypothetical protein